ncbi:MAG: endolytic transglycosylase MltG [Bacteroidota bacterium]
MNQGTRPPLSFRAKLFYASFAGIGTLIIVFVVYFYQIFNSANVQVGRDAAVSFLIPKGMSYEKLVDGLQKEQIVSDQMSFRFVSRFLEYDTPKPGIYTFEKDMSNLEAVRMLRAGDQREVKVTFNNIRLKPELAGRITQNLSADSTQLLKLLNDKAVAQKYGFTLETFPCMFLPNTYQMYWTTNAEGVLERMKREYDRFWTDERKQKADSLGLSPVEVSILASIVDAETIHNDEKAKVAGVYLNRLKRREPLGADPTVVFAVGDFSLKRVLKKHLEIDSPYNTYKYGGLPPGPIRVPSLVGIESVLNAENHKFMFFCAREDFSGYHNFARTNAEHERNAARYHRALNKRGIR